MLPAPSALRCTRVSARYGDTQVLQEVDLALGAGQVLAVLGPSGAGKTTLLHAVAGFISPSAGEIRLDDQLVAGPGVFVEPERRRIGVVFQDHALWPHLNVLDTVAYPLRRQGLSRGAAEAEARTLLDGLGLAELAARHPHQLSGGEQQRVGLARALARKAGLYILDEPTVHLDLPLRQVAQQLIDRGRREGRAAAVYTTHDASDALAVADQVAVLVGGRLLQVGTPAQVYEQPASAPVAGLTGLASVLHVQAGAGGQVTLDGIRVAVDGDPRGGARQLLVRPGWASLDGPFRGVVEAVRFHGPHTDHDVRTSVGTVVIRETGGPRAGVGQQVSWNLDRGWLLPPGQGSGV